jgi:hypothetical protein
MDPRFIPTGADLDALAKIQEDTVRNLARRYTAQGYEISPEQVDLLIRTIQGEAGREIPAGQHAVGNTILNRMAEGESFDRLAGAYDANGLRYAKTEGRSGVPANAGFRNTRPGSMGYNEGIEALMRPQSRFSKFTNLMPDSVKSAKQYYNPRVASPSWGGDNFIPLGNHVFGNEFQKTGENMLETRKQSAMFDGADVEADPLLFASYQNNGNTLAAADYEPEHQAPVEEHSPGWMADYIPPEGNPIMRGLPGKPGEIPGSWGDIFNKFDVFSKEFTSASLGPDATPKGPSSYVIPGEIYRPSPVRPKRKPYRPRKTRFADIMEGVSGPYG